MTNTAAQKTFAFDTGRQYDGIDQRILGAVIGESKDDFGDTIYEVRIFDPLRQVRCVIKVLRLTKRAVMNAYDSGCYEAA